MAISCLNVPVETVVGKVGLTVWEPSMQVLMCRVKDLGVRLEPVQLLCLSIEEGSRIFNGSFEGVFVLVVDKGVRRATTLVVDVLVGACLRSKGSTLSCKDRHPGELAVQHSHPVQAGGKGLVSHHRVSFGVYYY